MSFNNYAYLYSVSVIQRSHVLHLHWLRSQSRKESHRA